MKNYNITDIKLIKSPLKDASNKGFLTAYENIDPLFNKFERVFVVKSEKENVLRGEHAHIKCFQYLVCLQGAIKVVCNDSEDIKESILDTPELGILIPPTIWSKQLYIEPNTMLMVICDKKYAEDDYIRSFDEFNKFKRMIR